MHYSIYCDKAIGKLAPIWNSTGFTPGELLLTRDMQQALTYYGSVPHGSITYVRIHYLLELVKIAKTVQNRPIFDWTLLDTGLDALVKNRLKPFFELMGNPGTYFSDFNITDQLHQWKDMVTQLALHLMERYGRAEVESWYFETWNEPDAGWWPQWPHDIASFCNYYDACSEGLKSANPRLKFGGPGSTITLSPLFRTLMAHCDCGKNYFTGETGVRLDFISVHEKGAVATPEDINPNTAALWQREAKIIEYIRAHHPRLAELPFMNNECDPQVGWWNIHSWHGRPYYAALSCKVINQHLIGLADNLSANYVLLSNDNGFIGSWGNRTLLTRFGDPDLLEDGQSTHKPRIVGDKPKVKDLPFELIKKPVFNAWVMLSLLGDTRCRVKPHPNPDSPLGVIATCQGRDQVAVLLYHSSDRISTSGVEHVSLHFEGLSFKNACLTHYRIDEDHGDPFTYWENPPTGERPASEKPSVENFARMRNCQELTALAEPAWVDVKNGLFDLEFDLPLPSLSLILISEKPDAAPDQVVGVVTELYESLHGQVELMIKWQGLSSKTIRTYEVLCSDAPDGPYRRVNPTDLLCSAFLYVPENANRHYYKVRAVDFWGRVGRESEAVS